MTAKGSVLIGSLDVNMKRVLDRWKQETRQFSEDTSGHGIGRAGKQKEPVW